MHYILDALKIQVKCISLCNHGSFKTEWYIQTINNYIARHLWDKGKEWLLFVTSSCYAVNTFVSSVTGSTPYELVFLQKPSHIFNFYYQPLDTVAKGYRHYCIKMHAKLDNISSFITELKRFQQQCKPLSIILKDPLQKFSVKDNWYIFWLHHLHHCKLRLRNFEQTL